MTFAYFLHVDGVTGLGDTLQVWADEIFGPALLGTTLPQSVETYAPLSVDDYYLGNESGKLLMVEASFLTTGQLQTALESTQVADALAVMPKGPDNRVSTEVFTTRHFPLLDGSTAARRAPVSFVVRYYRPIDKENAFRDHYFKHHPPIMRHFPRIRNILCYEPVDWRDPCQIAPTNSFLGNEIVFDRITDLRAALSSEARHQLREDYHSFPPHEGETSHHAMQRRVLL